MLVDDRNRRVCVGCRRSLIAAPDLELDEVLDRRADAVAEHGAAATVPWGPALAAATASASASAAGTHDDAGGSLAVAVAERPTLDLTATLPEPDALDDALAPPRDAGTVVDDDTADTLDAGDSVDTDDTDDGEHVHDPDVAQATRDRLARMYDPRANAAVVVDATTPKPARATTARDDASPTTAPQRARRRRKVLLAVIALVATVFAVRTAADALGDDRALDDPTVPVERLPWREVSFGDLVAQFPGTSATSTFGDESSGVFTHRRFDLPDVSVTVIEASPAGVAPNDIGMRTVADRLLAAVGGRLVSGGVVDTGWGTAFTGTGTTPDGDALVYVARTAGSLVEVRADLNGTSGERARQVFDRITRSFQPV